MEGIKKLAPEGVREGRCAFKKQESRISDF